MNRTEEIARLKAKLDKTELEAQAWRTSGSQDDYMRCYCLAEALGLQLDALLREGAANP